MTSRGRGTTATARQSANWATGRGGSARLSPPAPPVTRSAGPADRRRPHTAAPRDDTAHLRADRPQGNPWHRDSPNEAELPQREGAGPGRRRRQGLRVRPKVADRETQDTFTTGSDRQDARETVARALPSPRRARADSESPFPCVLPRPKPCESIKALLWKVRKTHDKISTLFPKIPKRNTPGENLGSGLYA